MGLDVYVGSLTRYYARDWETVVAQYSRQQGLEYRVVGPDGKELAAEEPADPAEIRDLVLAWREQLNQALHGHIDRPLSWDESDEAPYFTDQPAWIGYASVVLWAAYSEHPELTRPQATTGDWSKDPAYLKSIEPGFKSRYPQLLHGAELWLPGDFDFTFSGLDAAGSEVTFGSVPRLLAELEELERRNWNRADSEHSQALEDGASSDASLEVGARFGLAVMLALAHRAKEHGLVMKLDY